MKVVAFEDNDSWLQFRKGKITGSKLGDLIVKRGTGKKIGFYELLADKLSIPGEYEDPMERGHRLESEAIDLFSKEIKKEITNELVIWLSDIDESIAYSPDGVISDTEVAEVKCLSSARHLQAYFEKTIPNEYHEQVVQAFIVNEKLETLYFVFYDPRVISKPIHCIEVSRESVEEDIASYLEYQKNTLVEINRMVAELTF